MIKHFRVEIKMKLLICTLLLASYIQNSQDSKNNNFQMCKRWDGIPEHFFLEF